ncbi:TRAM domain-containing protein [Candidatus Micrarchaeota archaeon]|nr:TRAM domain-containing protein [Candidatus Micrarchaeota archaeon]
MGDEKKFGIPKPVAVGDTVDVLIEGQGGQGDGIAKVDSFVVFVKGAAKGERCAVKITDVKRTFATGEKVGPAKGVAKESAEEMEEETTGEHDGPSG